MRRSSARLISPLRIRATSGRTFRKNERRGLGESVRRTPFCIENRRSAPYQNDSGQIADVAVKDHDLAGERITESRTTVKPGVDDDEERPERVIRALRSRSRWAGFAGRSA